MAKNKTTFSLDIKGGEKVLVDMANDLCRKSANAIGSRLRGLSYKFTSLSEYGDTEGFVDVSDGAIEETKSQKAKSPKGHRRAYYVKAGAYGMSRDDIQRLIYKAKDAGKV